MAEWLGNGLQNHAQQFDSAWHLDLLVINSAWHLDLLVISFSVINYVVSMSDPRVRRRRSFFLFVPNAKQVNHKIPASMNMAL